eukprot:gene17583-biopygen9853
MYSRCTSNVLPMYFQGTHCVPKVGRSGWAGAARRLLCFGAQVTNNPENDGEGVGRRGGAAPPLIWFDLERGLGDAFSACRHPAGVLTGQLRIHSGLNGDPQPASWGRRGVRWDSGVLADEVGASESPETTRLRNVGSFSGKRTPLLRRGAMPKCSPANSMILGTVRSQPIAVGLVNGAYRNPTSIRLGCADDALPLGHLVSSPTAAPVSAAAGYVLRMGTTAPRAPPPARVHQPKRVDLERGGSGEGLALERVWVWARLDRLCILIRSVSWYKPPSRLIRHWRIRRWVAIQTVSKVVGDGFQKDSYLAAGGDSDGQQSRHRPISKVAIQTGGESDGQQSRHRPISK